MLGVRVAMARRARGLAREDLARACALPASLLGRVENGGNPTAETILRIAGALRVDPGSLFGISPAHEPGGSSAHESRGENREASDSPSECL